MSKNCKVHYSKNSPYDEIDVIGATDVKVIGDGDLCIYNGHDVVFFAPSGAWVSYYITEETGETLTATDDFWRSLDERLEKDKARVWDKETAVPDGSRYLDEAYDKTLLTVVDSFKRLLDERIEKLRASVWDKETAVPDKDHAAYELQKLADLIKSGEVELLDIEVSYSDIEEEESIANGYAVAAVGSRQIMTVSYLKAS